MGRRFRLALVVLVAVSLVLWASDIATAKGKMKSASATVLSDGRLQVDFVEGALGKTTTSYRLQAGFYITWTCGGTYQGNTGGGGPNWQTPEQYATLSPIKGVVTGTLFHPRAEPVGALNCPDGSPPDMSRIEWTAITVTDLTNSRTIAVPDTARDF